MLMRFTFPMFDVDEDEPTLATLADRLADLYELTARFSKAQQDINDRMTEIVTNQQKLIDELKARLDKLKEEE